MRRITLIAVLILGTTGCVGKKKYTNLQGEIDALRTEMTGQLEAETSNSQDLEAALADEQARVAELEEKIKALELKNALLIKDKSQLDASVQDMQAALADLEARKAASDARVREYQDLLSKFKELIDAGRLTVKIVDGRMVVKLASDILFASGKAALSDEGRANLTDVAGVLASIPDRTFQVEGHTDNDPIKTERFPSNWELGAARAIAVVRTLNEGGVPITHLSAASYADNRPVKPNDSREGKASNRRIEIVVIPDLSLLPGYNELEALASGD